MASTSAAATSVTVLRTLQPFERMLLTGKRCLSPASSLLRLPGHALLVLIFLLGTESH